jgi:hypothetical protein
MKSQRRVRLLHVGNEQDRLFGLQFQAIDQHEFSRFFEFVQWVEFL